MRLAVARVGIWWSSENGCVRDEWSITGAHPVVGSGARAAPAAACPRPAPGVWPSCCCGPTRWAAGRHGSGGAPQADCLPRDQVPHRAIRCHVRARCRGGGDEPPWRRLLRGPRPPGQQQSLRPKRRPWRRHDPSARRPTGLVNRLTVAVRRRLRWEAWAIAVPWGARSGCCRPDGSGRRHWHCCSGYPARVQWWVDELCAPVLSARCRRDRSRPFGLRLATCGSPATDRRRP